MTKRLGLMSVFLLAGCAATAPATEMIGTARTPNSETGQARRPLRDIYGRFASPEQIKEQNRRLSKALKKELDEGSYFDAEASPKLARDWNDAISIRLRELPMTGPERGRLAGLDPVQMEALYQKASKNPVADYEKVKAYDPEGNFGFCFGRALNVYHQALAMGVAKENAKKIWAVGSMQYKKIMWGHHVAGTVRGSDGRWYVLDPEYGKVLEMREWMATVRRMDTTGTLLFFVSDGKRFGPESEDPISPDDVTPEAYNGYFADYMAESRREAAEVGKQRREATEAFRRNAR